MGKAKRKKFLLPTVSEAALEEARAWLEKSPDGLPQSVAEVLSFGIETALQANNPELRGKSLLLELRRALGILPSSERKRSGSPLSGLPKDERQARLDVLERCRYEKERLEKLAQWHKKLARKHAKEKRQLEDRLVALERDEDKELSAEEEAALVAEESRAFQHRFGMGDRCDLDSAKPAEALMQGARAKANVEEIDCLVDRDGLPKGAAVTGQFVEERERIDFSFSVTRMDLNIEKLAVRTQGGNTLVAASTEDIGPPKFKVTWEFLANMAILVSQYAMPLNRFAGLASSDMKRFTSAEVSRYFHYVAERLCPIYMDFPRQLACSAILSGDDTTSRVIEVTKTFKAREKDQSVALPWKNYATADLAQELLAAAERPSLAMRLAADLGFVFARKDGTGAKQGFYTTHLSGRSEAFEPRSTIIFYRSHFGSFGNLLDTILELRPADHRELVVQSDLATVNLVAEHHRERFDLTHIGCASHARRPFALHEGDDPGLCEAILHGFKGVAICEGGLDAYGRNSENSLAGRGYDARLSWEAIRDYATLLAKRWAPTTPLGEGARYVLKHYDKLTYYLQDHRLGPSNNFSERMLRMEKKIEDAALFRLTLEGRFALDIVRSVLQTAIAARVDLQSYLSWLFRMPADVVAKFPQEFSPIAFARLAL